MSKARDIARAGTALSSVDATELGYLDGVTSNVQTQLDGKQAANANVSTTELGYLDGVTSAIQTQLDSKVSTAGGSTIAVASGTTVPLTITNEGTGNSFVVQDSANPDSTPFVIDASGAVAIGAGTPIGKLYVAAESASATVVSAKVGTSPGGAFLTRSAGGTLTTPTVSSIGEALGSIVFQGFDGSNYLSGASILGLVDGTPGTNDMPGALVFSTTTDGSNSVAERLRISNTGATIVNYTTTTGGAVRNIYMSTSAPAGGSDGDVWIQYA